MLYAKMEELDRGTYDILWVLYQRDQELKNTPGQTPWETISLLEELFQQGRRLDEATAEDLCGDVWETMQAGALSSAAR